MVRIGWIKPKLLEYKQIYTTAILLVDMRQVNEAGDNRRSVPWQPWCQAVGQLRDLSTPAGLHGG